jgi:hypothetical protein
VQLFVVIDRIVNVVDRFLNVVQFELIYLIHVHLVVNDHRQPKISIENHEIKEKCEILT